MRAKYIQPDENLTPVGRWLAARMPHWDIAAPAWWFDDDSSIFRVFGFKPYYRFVVFDYSRYSGDWQLTVFGIRLKRHRTSIPGGG